MGSSELGVRILWVASGGFLFGIFLRSLLSTNIFFVLFLFVLSTAWFFSASRTAYQLRVLVPLAFIVMGLGMLRMNTALAEYDRILDMPLGTQIEAEGIVVDEPDARDANTRVPIRLQFASSSRAVTALAMFPPHTNIFYGEKVRVRGVLQVPQAFDAGAGRQFDYAGYLRAQGISSVLNHAELREGDKFAGNHLIAGAYKIKEGIVLGLEKALTEPQAGLAGGITVGDKRSLGKEITHEFQAVSLVHIIVLSGYNISVVLAYLFFLLSSIRAPKYVSFTLGACVALFFAIMTGFASASLRAALMALIAMTGKFSNRVYRPERALAVVAVGMVAWNPFLLMHDPGFQLSFLATFGLILFSPTFEILYSGISTRFLLRETLIATTSAQIAVLPLLVYESGNLSIIGIAANIFVLPILPLTMIFSAIAAVAGIAVQPLAPIIALPADFLLSYVLAVAHYFSRVPFASITIPAFGAWWLLPVYGALFIVGVMAVTKNAALESRAAQKEILD